MKYRLVVTLAMEIVPELNDENTHPLSSWVGLETVQISETRLQYDRLQDLACMVDMIKDFVRVEWENS